MARFVMLLLFVVSSAAFSGCARGTYRRIQLGEDLTPGDVAHYSKLADGRKQLEDYLGGFPFIFPAVFLRGREATADKVDGTSTHYHFEDVFSTLHLVANRIVVSNYDETGKSLSHDSTHKLLLGLVSVATGHRRLEDDELATTGGFSLFWSGFGYERATHSRTLRLFWIPFVSRDASS